MANYEARYLPHVYNAAQKYGLNPALFASLIKSESGFNPAAVSSKNAVGLGQLIPGTAQRYGVSPAERWNPLKNLDASANYFADLINRYKGNNVKALAAYNAGEKAVDRYGGVPPYQETQTYVSRVMQNTQHYIDKFGLHPLQGLQSIDVPSQDAINEASPQDIYNAAVTGAKLNSNFVKGVLWILILILAAVSIYNIVRGK